MRSFSVEMAGSLLVDWAPPAEDALVCDIGGGAGHMTADGAPLPEAQGIVFDLPPVAKRAMETLAELGVSDRVSTVGGSFLEPLPAALSSCASTSSSSSTISMTGVRLDPPGDHAVAGAVDRHYLPHPRRRRRLHGCRRNMDINMMAVNLLGAASAGLASTRVFPAIFAVKPPSSSRCAPRPHGRHGGLMGLGPAFVQPRASQSIPHPVFPAKSDFNQPPCTHVPPSASSATGGASFIDPGSASG